MTGEPDTTVVPAPEDFGTYGAPRIAGPGPVAATFRWYDEADPIQVHPYASELDLILFMGEAADLDENDVRAIPALTRLLKAFVHPDDWPRFWQAARRNHAETADFLALCDGITRRVTGRPTGRPADSSAGPSQNAGTSTGASASTVERALVALADRPDLAGFIVDAQTYAQDSPGSATG